MVTEHLALAEERLCATPTGAADGDHNAYDNPSELRADAFGGESLGAFASPDELDEYLRTFAEGGNGDEAEIQTQGTDDIGGEPTTTVH